MAITQPDSTLTAIRLKVRRLTASSSEQSLSTDIIDQAINTFYQNDFPYGIKLDQMRDVYTFFTKPNVDRYPINVNFVQGLRAPVYFEGLKGFFYKKRDEFYSVYVRNPTKSTPFVGDGSTPSFSFTVSSVPFLAGEFVLSVQDTNGNQIIVSDVNKYNGVGPDENTGYLFYQHANGIVPQPNIVNGAPPPEFLPTPLPGMPNFNLSGQVNYDGNDYQSYPGDRQQTLVGTVNYVSGVVTMDLTPANVIPAADAQATLWVSQYQVGRPYALLFWNNELIVRPVPDNTYKVEVECYLTPVQFLETSDYPILNQWWQYLAYGAAMEILRERQDLEGLENLREGFIRQEALVLERQATEEIGQRNSTIFSGSTPNQGSYNNFGWPF